jgi:hypothetical protein
MSTLFCNTIMAATAPPPMTFEGHMADAELKMATAEYEVTLWEPEFGWSEEEKKEAAADPYSAQLLAALQIFLHIFTATAMRAWVHLAAEMQAGKTGVITALIRLILQNHSKLNIRPDHIFVVTGMSDKAWMKQTRDRLPSILRDSVYHGSSLTKFEKRLKEFARDDYLSNVVIFVDESHIASSVKNRPNKHVYQVLAHLCPRRLWQERNIRIITISATDPAKVMEVDEAEMPCAVVRLQTASNYQSIAKLNEAGRIRYLENFGDVMTVKGRFELKRALSNEFKDTPLYHIIRARQGKAAEFEAFLKSKFPEADVLRYDAETKGATLASASGDGSSVSLESLKDINEILSEAPTKPTFIILKNMFYAAKTLDDTHVGILWDRCGAKHDTNLQSLLGRACGYGKSTHTIIYASKETVDSYSSLWREACSNPKMDRVVEVPATKVDKKMQSVRASFVSATTSRLSTTSTSACPFGVGIAYDSEAGLASNRLVAVEENFTSTWKCIKPKDATLASVDAAWKEAKELAPRSRASKNTTGFYECSTTGKKQVLRFMHVLVMKGGKKTANMHWEKLEVGKSASRLYVCYTNVNDPTTALFYVRTLTRVK